jgi:hypothetical protein
MDFYFFFNPQYNTPPYAVNNYFPAGQITFGRCEACTTSLNARQNGSILMPDKERRVATKIGKKKPAASTKRKPIPRKPRFIVNEHDERVEVVIPIEEYRRLLDELEVLEDIRDARISRRENKWETLTEVKQHLSK